MTDLSPESLRLRFDTILDGLQHPLLGSVAALTEECGEVAKVLLDHHAYGQELDRDALGSELMDVFVCLCEIATLHGVDLDVAARAKVEDLERRAPKWRHDMTMTGALAKARRGGSAWV